jgi:Predicted oxidoreductases of the aldo/keto reductase family
MNKSGQKLSILGYGCMRLPTGEDGKIKRDEAISEIRYAIDHGVNYLDSAYIYNGGESEVVLGEALEDGYREKVNVATKLPGQLCKSREQMDAILNEQLTRLQTDHIDYYLLHGLNQFSWKHVNNLNVKDFLDKAIADGRIRYAGFSFHDHYNIFREIVDSYDWTFCQFQYNYLDENFQAGTKGLKYAASKGLGIVIMEPLHGGALATPIPAAENVWRESMISQTPAELGLKWVWDHPEVTVVLSGMNRMEHVKENIKYAEEGLSNSLTPKEKTLINKVGCIYKDLIKVQCTGCGYCMPCPIGIRVPDCFTVYNNASMFDSIAAKKGYQNMVKLGHTKKASECIECGQCTEKCPQHLPISQRLKEVVNLFGE